MNMTNILRLLTIAFTLFFSSTNTVVLADEEINTKPLTASLQEGQTLKIEEPTATFIQLSLAHGYHAYADKFVVKVIGDENLSVTRIEPSPLVKFMDVATHKEKEGIKDNAQLKVWFKASQKLGAGLLDTKLEITYQACTEKHCLFPTKLMIPAKFMLSQSEITESTDNMGPTTSALSFESALQKGVGFTFLFVFIAGILTSLTPCIFPMIPITLSIIGASQIRGGPGSHEAVKSARFRGFVLSVVYVLGIALTYATLGLIAAKTGALFGAALSNPIVVITIAILFVALGLSMYGLYEIQMPAFIRDRLSAAKTDAGFVGAFAAGLIAGIVASPCVGPVLVSVLAYVAQTQNAILGFTLLFTFAIGMGILLIAIGTFSSLAGKLPRSGPWMNTVKFIFGTAMIAMAIYYVHPLIPSLTNKQVHIESDSAWKPYTEAEFDNAVSSGQPVIVDFYADWCGACKELERFTFSDPNVQNKLKEFTLFRVDMTVETKENSGLKDKFHIIGLPTMHIYNHGKLLNALTLTGFESKNDFVIRLDKAL